MQLRNRSVSRPAVEKVAGSEPGPVPGFNSQVELKAGEVAKIKKATPKRPERLATRSSSRKATRDNFDSDDDDDDDEKKRVSVSELDETADPAEETPEPAGVKSTQSDSGDAIQIHSNEDGDNIATAAAAAADAIDDDHDAELDDEDEEDELDDEDEDEDEIEDDGGDESDSVAHESDVEMIVDTTLEQHESCPSKETVKTGAEKKVREFRNHKLSLTCICLDSKDRYAYTASKDGSLIKWCMSTRRILKKLNSIRKKEAKLSKELEERNHVNHINAIAISDDSKFLATGGWDKRVRIWSPDDLQWLHTFTLHRQEITALAFRRGHHMLYSGSADRSVMLWTLEEDENRCFVESLIGHESPITSMDTTRKERVLTSGGRDQSIRIWKIVEQAQTVFQSKHQSVDVARFINDQLFVSGGEDGHLTLWTTMKRSPLYSIKAHDGVRASLNSNNWITSLATFYLKQTGGKNNKITKASGKSAKRRKLNNHAAGQMFDDHDDDVNTEEEDPDRSDEENVNNIVEQQSDDAIALVASGSCDCNLHIWKLVKNSLELHQTIECAGYINDLKFTSDGSRVVAACAKEHRFGRWSVAKGAKNCWQTFDVNKL